MSHMTFSSMLDRNHFPELVSQSIIFHITHLNNFSITQITVLLATEYLFSIILISVEVINSFFSSVFTKEHSFSTRMQSYFCLVYNGYILFFCFRHKTVSFLISVSITDSFLQHPHYSFLPS